MRDQFANEADRFMAKIDSLIDENRAAGWVPGAFRIRKTDGGLLLERHTAMTSGSPVWKAEYFTRDHAGFVARVASMGLVLKNLEVC